MSGFRYFKCVKSFSVEPVDDNGMFLDNEPPVTVLKDTVWEVEYRNGKPTWIAYQLDGYGRLMEMRKEHWEDTEYFEEVEELDE